ncbi:MAG: AAA family ATPase [Desulfurococcales archaeon]|nr:AAA family ATPase [Desulfurococcales archaeon]MCE4621814.1 AAA family ATPase [Desulfurococcales archaeon]MCE4626769.1 AAA family ATPase [Desulfurococcales archaeon]MCE4629570.1 AAA family ATPase [Desulfurococcales archaeon]
MASHDYVILVVGVPGTGKTTAAHLLSNILGCKSWNSSQLLRKLGLVERDPTGRKTYVIRDEELEAAAKVILSTPGCSLLETIYPLEWLSAGLEDHIPVILLLRTHPVTLYNRLAEARKDWPKEKIIENVLAEAHNTLAEELLKEEHYVIEVDTTGLSPMEVVNAFLDRLEAWDTGIRIDWLARDPELVELVARWSMQLDLDKYRFGY